MEPKIPENLEECFEFLKKHTPYGDLEEFKNTPENRAVAMCHHGTGTWLRNQWGLWRKESVLAKYFNALGIYHADDMSGIILKSLHRHLNNRRIKLDKQIKHYRDYWSKVDPKVNEGGK